MNAQNQHYVPRFILRHFLANDQKEQVAVYDKHTDRTFTTAIKNIMAERRFHDFTFEDWTVSYENIVSRVEEVVLPTYSRVVAEGRLRRTNEEKANLALLIAFQFMRTKSHRNIAQELEGEIRKKVEGMGGRMEDLEGWKPSTEDDIKREHLQDLQRNVGRYAKIIAEKHIFLSNASKGRGFYLGDNPVCLNNGRDFGPYGNLGLAVPGIEMYLPLTSDLMLAAWCPSIIPSMRGSLAKAKASHESDLLTEVMAGRLNGEAMRTALSQMEPYYQQTEQKIATFEGNDPVNSDTENMDFYNSMQMRYAHRYVISKHADFDLAVRYNREFPHLRTGPRISFG